jgi:hypothetical protein
MDTFQNSERKSILDLLNGEFASSGSPILDEIMIFGTFYQKKMMDREDRLEIMNMGRRAAKLGILCLFISGVSNRLLTKLKFRKFDFLNLRFFLRFPIRIGVTTAVFYFGLLLPIIGHLLVILEKTNSKYYKRFEEFKTTGDPLTMNPGLLDEPDYTEEQRANTLQFVENVRMQQKQAQMQGKMM